MRPNNTYEPLKQSKPPNIDLSVLEKIVDTELMKEWGHYLATGSEKEKVKTTQLRKFFGAVKKIQADFENKKNEIVLLSPKLAYAVGRNKNNKVKDLYSLLNPLINNINEDKKKFKNFVNVFEAIVAYHKEKGE